MIRRRTALGLMAAGTIGAAALPAAERGPGRKLPAFDPASQDQLAMVFRKLAYSLDDSVTFWWMHGRRYGVVGSLATPFWDMHIGAWFTTRDLPDGRYEVRMAGANYYTAPGETPLLEKFRNPYTGKTVDVPYARPKASTTVYDRRGGSPFAGGNPPGAKSVKRTTDVGPAWVEGDELRVRGDIMMHVEPEDPAKPTFTVQDWSLYVGSLADALDPAVRNPPAQQMFNDILNFPAWLQMGDQPGTFFSHCFGRKVFRYEQMPARWRSLFEYRFPDVAKDPAAVLRG